MTEGRKALITGLGKNMGDVTLFAKNETEEADNLAIISAKVQADAEAHDSACKKETTLSQKLSDQKASLAFQAELVAGHQRQAAKCHKASNASHQALVECQSKLTARKAEKNALDKSLQRVHEEVTRAAEDLSMVESLLQSAEGNPALWSRYDEMRTNELQWRDQVSQRVEKLEGGAVILDLVIKEANEEQAALELEVKDRLRAAIAADEALFTAKGDLQREQKETGKLHDAHAAAVAKAAELQQTRRASEVEQEDISDQLTTVKERYRDALEAYNEYAQAVLDDAQALSRAFSGVESDRPQPDEACLVMTSSSTEQRLTAMTACRSQHAQAQPLQPALFFDLQVLTHTFACVRLWNWSRTRAGLVLRERLGGHPCSRSIWHRRPRRRTCSHRRDPGVCGKQATAHEQHT